ncbi:hypothetical protein J2Z19_005466 [Ensifer adhaerens]|uniref:Uncharacterized protein n=1 Tax=Ensifer adhaerens TaxID=106592 RepID=A0ACC5T4Z7_ENSAD|nr:hypothetical protein [Ensifer adhaerens]MBP1875729.1 hypothetical protein [Ensifer adhaerens]
MTTEVTLHTVNEEPRVLDTDLAERLGYARPRKIRDLIFKHSTELLTYGSIAPTRGAYRGKEFTTY